MNDLFMNDKEKLWEWLRVQSYVRTSEINRWGCTQGYSNRATRNARNLANDGKLRRISDGEKKRFGIKTKEGIYEVIK